MYAQNSILCQFGPRNLSSIQQLISQPILVHFWWELYHSTITPERTINYHFTYHVAQASKAKHASLVDRGSNGGLAGSDVRILSRSSRKCTVTGIDSHELQGLDVVQCAALVETNHGIVNLIINEYACYGKGHTIHSNRKISKIFPLVSCCSCVNIPSSS